MDAFTRSAYTVQCTLSSTYVLRAIDECTNCHNSVKLSRTAKVETPLERSSAQLSRDTRELGKPYTMLFCLDDLDQKKHRDVINSYKFLIF